MKYVDLHLHTTFSDGTVGPKEVVKQARQQNLVCIAITDHDAVLGIGPASEEAAGLGLEVIPGVELTAEANDCEIHILGYFIDWQEQWFQEKLVQIRQVRQDRAMAILEKLKAQGISLDSEEILRLAVGGSVGRLHIARILAREGYVSSIQEAFNKYLSRGRSCYVKKLKLTPAEAINMLTKLRGLAVLAHPYTIGNDQLIAEFARLGLRGIEAYYPEHNQATSDHYQKLAQKLGLLVTGGSDYHGQAKEGAALGGVKVPYAVVEALKAAVEDLRSGKK